MKSYPSELSMRRPRQGRLLRVLGVGFGLAVTVGGTIGMGILRTPGQVAAQLPDPWLFLGVWAVGGLYALFGALSVAELGVMTPRAGGPYAFARRAFGTPLGFAVGWTDWLATCGVTAAISMVVGEYAGALLPALSGRGPAVAVVVVLGFAALHWRGVRWGSRAQGLTSLVKALAFLALVVCCFALGGGGPAERPATHPLPTGLALVSAVVLALQGVLYTYDGWSLPVYFGEEGRDPARNIPRSMLGGVGLTIGIYLLVNVALLYVLPLPRIAGERLAVGAAARELFGPHGGTVIAGLAALSMLSAVNSCTLLAPRILFAMGRDGVFPRPAARVNAGGTPTVGLLLSSAVPVFLILSGSLERVLAVLVFFNVTNYAVTFASVFVLRWREPQAARPYRAWGYPWTTGLVLLGSLAFLAGAVAGDTENSIYALLFLAASFPVFLVFRRLGRPRQGTGQSQEMAMKGMTVKQWVA
jgi:basic amino acid/polyamine antiporter, APA family